MKESGPFDRGIILLVIALLCFGMVMVFSTSSAVTRNTHVFWKHVIFTLAGVAAMLVAMRVDYRIFARPGLLYPLIALTVLLLMWALLSPPIAGTRRWIVFGGYQAQPSEIAKLVGVIWTSYFLTRKGTPSFSIKTDLLPYGTVLGLLVVLILAGPDLGTSACLGLTAAFLLFLGGLPITYYATGFLLAIPSFYFLVYRVPYRRDRILTFLDPDLDPLGIGYQIRQSLIAVGSGGVTGLGLARGEQKLSFLPEPHTDFVFAIVGEELGLVGSLALLVLFLLFFWRGVKVALRAETPFGTYLGLGIVGMIVLQALINMSVVVSLLPTKGIPLPFISVGGSSMLVTLAAVGILLNISRQGRTTSSQTWLRR